MHKSVFLRSPLLGNQTDRCLLYLCINNEGRQPIQPTFLSLLFSFWAKAEIRVFQSKTGPKPEPHYQSQQENQDRSGQNYGTTL